MTNEPLDIVICRTPLAPPAPIFSGTAGAVLDFWGVVRGLEGEESISGIDYEAHESMALHQMEILCRDAAERFPVERLILHHRVGFVPTAEPSLFLRVSAGHRRPAFEAARWVIEELKARIPIWKHPMDSIARKEVPLVPLP